MDVNIENSVLLNVQYQIHELLADHLILSLKNVNVDEHQDYALDLLQLALHHF